VSPITNPIPAVVATKTRDFLVSEVVRLETALDSNAINVTIRFLPFGLSDHIYYTFLIFPIHAASLAHQNLHDLISKNSIRPEVNILKLFVFTSSSLCLLSDTLCQYSDKKSCCSRIYRSVLLVSENAT
jgi:hypothetical protein